VARIQPAAPVTAPLSWLLYQLCNEVREVRKNIRPAIISLGWVTGVTERLDLAAENANIGSQVMPILIVALVALGAWLAIGVMLGSAVVLEQHTRKKQAH
jgi:hypothetical protein